jgi:hypothetical protein
MRFPCCFAHDDMQSKVGELGRNGIIAVEINRNICWIVCIKGLPFVMPQKSHHEDKNMCNTKKDRILSNLSGYVQLIVNLFNEKWYCQHQDGANDAKGRIGILEGVWFWLALNEICFKQSTCVRCKGSCQDNEKGRDNKETQFRHIHNPSCSFHDQSGFGFLCWCKMYTCLYQLAWSPQFCSLFHPACSGWYFVLNNKLVVFVFTAKIQRSNDLWSYRQRCDKERCNVE